MIRQIHPFVYVGCLEKLPVTIYRETIMQKQIKLSLISNVSRRVFEGEPVDPIPAPIPAPTPAPTPTPVPLPIEKTPEFNRILNKALADDRRKSEEKQRALATELSALREGSNLTQQQRDSLQMKIEEIEATFRTAEEQKKIEISKMEDKYTKDLTAANKKSDEWHGRHDNLLTRVEIGNASLKFKAFDAEQIEALLSPNTKVTERDGKFMPIVKFNGRDKELNPVVLDLTIDEAVKAMHEWPEKYGNLFENTAKDGLGQSNNGSIQGTNGRIPDIGRMSTSQYKQNRDLIRAQMAQKPAQ